MLKELFHDSFENLEIKRISMENHASVDGKIFFSYESSTFLRPLQSLLLKYTAENSLVT